MGLDVYLYHGAGDAGQQVELPSAKSPDHLFKIGYFRSSYNGSGFNGLMEQRGVPDLYAVFAPGDEYEFKPDWSQCRQRAQESLAAFNTSAEKCRVRVSAMTSAGIDDVKDDTEALAKYVAETAKPSVFDAYERGGAYYSKDGLKVFAILPGKNSIGHSCVYVVHEEANLDWLRQAWEIVIETCDYVLSRPDPEAYVLHWSS